MISIDTGILWVVPGFLFHAMKAHKEQCYIIFMKLATHTVYAHIILELLLRWTFLFSYSLFSRKFYFVLSFLQLSKITLLLATNLLISICTLTDQTYSDNYVFENLILWVIQAQNDCLLRMRAVSLLLLQSFNDFCFGRSEFEKLAHNFGKNLFLLVLNCMNKKRKRNIVIKSSSATFQKMFKELWSTLFQAVFHRMRMKSVPSNRKSHCKWIPIEQIKNIKREWARLHTHEYKWLMVSVADQSPFGIPYFKVLSVITEGHNSISKPTSLHDQSMRQSLSLYITTKTYG